MKKQTMWIIIGVAVLALLAGGLLCLYFGTRENPTEGQKHITVNVTHADGSVKTFEYHTDAQYLGAFLSEQGLIEGEQGEYGMVVCVVDGEEADWGDNVYWAVYENGTYASEAADKIVIKDGGIYGLVYESF